MRTSWHVWVVGIVSLLWNAVGALDYLMTQLGIAAYLDMLTEAQRAYLASRPVWADAFWALGVWGAVLASVLILLRSGWSQLGLMLAIVGFVGFSVWSYAVANPGAAEVMGQSSMIFSAVILLVLILQLTYARAMTARGILR